MQIIDGKKIAGKILRKIAQEVKQLAFRPVFCDVLVGDNPVSLSYVNIKGKIAKAAGFDFRFIQIPEKINQPELISEILKLNFLKNICGLIVQLPLPVKFSYEEVLNCIDPRIDVDCLGNVNKNNFYNLELKHIQPPTASAVVELLEQSVTRLSEKKILVIGQGELVGKPVAHLLREKSLQVEIADRETLNLPKFSKKFDVIISGAGHPGLITADWIKPGCTVIDAGTAEQSGQIVGDVDFKSVSPIAGKLSPVPGGVGPVTVAKLLENALKVAKTINLA